MFKFKTLELAEQKLIKEGFTRPKRRHLTWRLDMSDNGGGTECAQILSLSDAYCIRTWHED